MAKILYGVAGEGFGHSSRSELFGRRLLEAGHEVLFAASGKSLAYLQPSFAERVKPVYGLHFCYENGRILPWRTLCDNVRGYREGHRVNRRLFGEIAGGFAPDMVISDFEPFTAWWAWRNRVPCLSVDHEHLLTLGVLEKIPGFAGARRMAGLVTRGYHTFADAYLVLNFFDVPLRGRSSVLLPPVVRPWILTETAGAGEHITVYCTDSGEAMRERLLSCLNQFARERFLVYGFNRDLHAGNCILKTTSASGFIRDLACGRGVIATAGFSLISECLHFGKRMLLIPVQGQYEQIVNAHYIEKLGLGMFAGRLETPYVAAFLETLEHPLPTGKTILKPDNDRAVAMIDRAAAAVGVPLHLSDQVSLGGVREATTPAVCT